MYAYYRMGRRDISIDMWNEEEIERFDYFGVIYSDAARIRIRIFNRTTHLGMTSFFARRLFPEGLPKENRMLTCMESAILENLLMGLGYIASKEQKGESNEIVVDKPNGE